MHRTISPHTGLVTGLSVGLVVALVVVLPGAASPTDGTGADSLEQAMAEAETSLRRGEPQIAESRYRTALYEGWLLLGQLRTADGSLETARDAFERASTVSVERRRALVSLALVELELGAPERAVGILHEILLRQPGDLEIRRLLARALAAAGRSSEATQELEAVLAAAPEDLETAFTLATAHLQAEQPEAADELFERLAEARPLPATYVLIGRTYRDFHVYDRARAALEKALELDPTIRRARYYLGTVDLLEDGRARLDEAIARFRAELELVPEDPSSNLYLGLALVESRRFEEALAPLELARRAGATRLDALHFLGRAELRLGRAEDAAATLRHALEVADAASAEAAPGNDQLASIHYQLAQTLRRLDRIDEANEHFAAAEHHSKKLTGTLRDNMSRYLDDETTPAATSAPLLGASLNVSALAALPAAERDATRRQVEAVLARATLNLGVMLLRGSIARPGAPEAERFLRAAELLAEAKEIDPGFPGVDHPLAIALFNAGHYDAVHYEAALEPLERALAGRPDDLALTRMLALARFETGDPGGAADLLADDPGRDDDLSLQYTYGQALVRSGRAVEAERIFADLLARHGDRPELHVVLGQAHAQQGDFKTAIETLERALELSPDVAEAHGALGMIYLRQGRLDKAEAALRAELAARPDDPRARYHLATVLDLNRRPEEAEATVRRLLESSPTHADGRYLLGKLLLARGEPRQAARELEIAAELSPTEPQIHYQLGQAFQKLGDPDRARLEFERFRVLKRAERGDEP